MKEIVKDILFMGWSFVGAGIMWFLILNLSFKYVTGNIIWVGEILEISLLWFGVLFFVLIGLILLLRFIYLKRFKKK